MRRSFLLATALLVLLPVAWPAGAQERSLSGDSARDGAGVRAPYVTSTGATVPHPGQSQSGGTTPLDKGVQNEDNKIDGSICKGC